MIYLSLKQLLFIHRRLIEETGGSFGLRDKGLLEAALARPKATFDGVDLYPDVFSKAAALLESLVNNHPFVDGNKRVGITSAAMFLQQNGIFLTATNADLEAFTLQVAENRLELAMMIDWLRNNCRI